MDKHCIIRIFAGLLMSLCGCFTVISAQETVKGYVVNSSTGDKFVGASIVVVGTQTAAISDDNGAFELSGVDLRGVLRVESPGCELQYVPLQGRREIRIKLIPASTAQSFYDEISFSPVKTSAIGNVNVGTMTPNENIGMSLSGHVRNVSHSGIDAAGSAMFIRGLHTLNMTSQPLYIVDGIIWQSQENQSSIHDGYFGNPLSLISPDDIESIQVLKNGTAIYGAKAANGVVIINTKRSHNMATEITINISAGIKSPFKTIPVMNASDYRVYATDMMSGLSGSLDVNNYNFINDDESRSSYLASHNQTNWLDCINRSALTQNYNVNIRGGDDVALYSFTVGYSHNDGNIDNTDFERLNVRFNSDIKLTDRLSTKADISFAQITRDLFDDGINSYTSPLYLAYIKSPLYNPYQYDTSGKLYDQLSDKDELGIGNPLAITENADGATKNYRFTANLQPKYTFSDKLSLSAVAAFSFDKVKENSFTPDFGLSEVQLYNADNDWYGEGVNSVSSYMTRQSTLTLGLDVDWTPLKGLHNLGVTGGFLFINDTFESDYGLGYNTGSDNLKSLSNTQSSLRTMDGVDEDWRTLSWHAKADYNYLSRYFLSALLSVDSNSRFGRNAAGALHLAGISWGVFPSVNASWIVSNENFMSSLRGIDYLRLRVSWDKTGNDDIPSNAMRTYFQTVSYAGLAKGLALANIGNDGLKWETTSTLDLGVDMNLFGNRLSLSADVFFSKTSDMLVQRQLREEFGLANYWTNSGELGNQGFEISANAKVINSGDWKLNAGLVVGHYKNKVKSLSGETYINTLLDGEILTSENNPLGVFYGYKALGVFASQSEAEAANLALIDETGKRVAFEAGDVHFEDVDGDGIISSEDRQIIGDPNPDIYGNFNIGLQYKAFSLDALFTYSLGNDAYNALRASLESESTMYNQSAEITNRWRADGQITNVPKATYGDPMGNSRFSSRWIEDASYLKLRQIRANYTLPIKPRIIQGASIWVAVNNVFTVTRYLGSDPEFSYGNSAIYQGVDAGLTPSTRSYNIGVKLNL